MGSPTKEQLFEAIEASQTASQLARHVRDRSRAVREAAEWKAIAQAYQREAEEANARCEALLGLTEAKLTPRPVVSPKPRKGELHSPSTACLFCSDWHIDERVRPTEVPGGRNRYSSEIAEDRIHNLGRNFIKLVNGARSDTTITQAVVFLAGDLFSGWIHEELRSSTEMTPVQAVDWLQPRIVRFLDQLASEGDFQKIHVLCVPGNHSRITLKEYANPAGTSLEWLLYRWLASHYQGNHQFAFQLSLAKRTVTPIGRVRTRWMHGNDWNYGGGVGGVIVPMMRATNRWDTDEHAQFTACGHWHNYYPSARHVINGSLIGYTAYGSRFGPWEPPQQAFWLVSHKFNRVTLQAPVFVE